MVEEQQPQQPPTGTVVDLGRKVKAKYPGVYDSLPDDEVGRKVKEKYPGAYDGFSDVTPQQPPAPAVPGKPQAPSAPMASPSISVAGSSPVGSGAGQTAPEFVPRELPPDLIGASRITQEPDMASVAVDQTNTLMTPGEQEFRKEFAPMDLAAVKEFKEKKIPQKMQLIQQQQAGLEADKKALEEARVQLESSLAQAQQQMAENPAIAPQLQAQYQADVDRYNQMVASANKQAESMKDLARSVEADYQKADLQEYNLKSQQGGFFGASHNKIVEGVLSMASVVPDFGIDMITGLTPESMLPSIGGAAGKSRDQLAKEWKRDIIPAFKEAGMDLWRSGTTEEYEAEMNKGILGRSWLGLMQSAPAMATPMMSGIFLQVYDGAKEEMRGTEWDGVPEGEKNAMAALLALPATALERMGFSNLAANNPFVKQVMARALTNLPKNATKEQIEAVINAETTDAVMNYGIRAAGATIAEAETGGMQYVTDVAMKDMFNRFLGEDGKFELPKSWGEYAQGAIMSAAEEGIGGFIMGQLPALAAARRAKKNVGEVTTDTQFELLEETLKNPEYLPMMQEQLKRQVESAKISEAQAAETIASWKEAQQIVSKIPEDLQTEKRREAFDLLTQKAKLSKMDKALVGDKVAAIDAKLMKLAGVEPDSDTKKQEAKYDAAGSTATAALSLDPSLVIPTSDQALAARATQSTGDTQITDGAVSGVAVQGPGITPTATQADIDAATGVTEVVEPVVEEGAVVEDSPQVPKAPSRYMDNAEQTSTIKRFTHTPSGGQVRTMWADWFLGEDVAAKSRIAYEIDTNEDLQAAMKSGLYDLWRQETKNNDVSFEDFLDMEIELYRGVTPRNVENGGISEEGFTTYTLQPDIAEKFARGGEVRTVKKKVSDLYGALQIVGGEIEVLEPTQYSEEFARRLFNERTSEYRNLPEPDIRRLVDTYNSVGYNEAYRLGEQLLKQRASEPESTPQQDATQQATGGQPLSSQSLQDAFGYTKEVADATEAIADAMGLDKSKIKVVKGGDVGDGALRQDEAFDGPEQPKTPIGDTKTVMVDGRERTVFNSNGKPIHPTVEGVRNFWRWFGDSKVVDAEGRPLVVYHGTKEDFDVFAAKYGDGLISVSMDAEFAAKYGSNKNKPDDAYRNYPIEQADKDRKAANDFISERIRWGDPARGEKNSDHYDAKTGELLSDEEFLAVMDEARDRFPSPYLVRNTADASVMPIYVSAKKIFDPSTDYALIEPLLRSMPRMQGIVEKGHHKDGHWIVYENEEVVAWMKQNGYDAQYVRESSADIGGKVDTINVFDPTQIKSATGNYGTFDPNNPSILQQDAKGAVEFAEGGDAIIRALQNPDQSTGVHELAHVARRFLLDRNVPQENRLGITDAHIETAEQWSGAKDGNWTREAEEKFARGFERYLRDGNAPNEALKDVFAKFKQWLTDIYRNLFNSPVKEMVSPEMRKVFDALVTRGPQTKAPRTAETTVATKANDAAPEPAAPPPAEPAKPEPKEPSRPMRGSAKRMKEQYPELYAALGDDTIYYDRLPMTVTRDAASELVGWLGLERAKDEVLNRSSDIPDAVRAMMGRMVMRKLADEHRLAELDTFAENFFKLGTSAGQFINALRDVYEEFSKEMIFYRVQKIVEKEVERKKGKDKNYKKLRDGLEKVNKEVVEEVVRTRKVREKTNEAAAPQQKQSGSEKIRKAWNWDKNKVVKKDRKAEILKALRGTFGTGPNPLYVELAAGYVEAGARTFAAVAEVVASELGNKAVPYFKEAYKKAFKFLKDQGVDAGEPSTDAEIDEEIARFNTKAMVDQLRKAIASNDKKTASELIGKLQQTSKDFDAWGLYKEYAVSRLKRMADREIADDIRVDDDVREFADGLVRNITDQMKKEAEAKGLEPKEPKTPKSAIEIIGDAYRNFDKYEQVWRDTQAEWKRRLNAAEARLAKATTSEAKQKAQADIAKEKARLEKLDAYYGELMVKPFSEAAIGRAVKDGMKELNQKIDEIIRQHYTVYEAAKRSLADKLVQDAGLTEPEATKLADAVKAEFERLATERKKALVEQYAKRKFGDGKITRAERKGIEDELIFLTNTGAFSEAEFIEKYGKLRKWPKLTEENIKEIERLADRIQTAPPGRPRLEAIEDLLGYQENLSGVSKWEVAQSVWFANMLSGFETQEVNFLANQINLSAEIAVAVAKSTVKGKPVDAVNIVRALGYGFARGWYEAGAVMSTGYSPIRGRVDIPPALERYKFPKYLAMYSGLKYVRRFMVAADVLGFEPLKELRAYQYAAMKARSVDPSPIDRQKALDILNRDDSTISDAHNQAEQEYQADLKDIEARNLSAKDKKKAITKAERDKKRRAFELVELGRDPEVLQESARFAARATYNYTPEGALGVPAKMINMGLDALPALRYVIPFVNIIANVANEALNYYAPISFARALAGGPVTDTIMRRANKGMTEDQKKMHREDLLAKAMIGLVLQAAVLVLSEPGDDDDPLVEITANGYNNYKQNTEMESKGLWKPYSFRLRGTDTWISYQYTPLLFAFGMAGHLRDAVKYRKEKLDDTFLTQWAVATERNIGTITDATFLSTTADALSWLTDTKEGGLEGLAKSFAKTTKAMVVPYSALLSQIQQNMEASFGVPKIDARGSMTAELIKNTPVAYFIRDNYPIMIDALGDPIIPTGGSLRRFFSTSDPDPGLLKKLFMAAPAPDRFWRLMVDKKYPLSAPNRNTVTVYDEQEDKERLLTDQELMTFYQKRGALIKEALNDDFEALSAMDNKEFAEEMRSIQTYASEEAKWAATGGE